MKTPQFPPARRGVTAALILGLGIVATAWGTTSAPSSSPAPAAAPYIEAPQPTITTVTSTYGGGSFGGFYGGGYYGGYSGPYFHDSIVTTWVPRRYFFPPRPPALGESYTRNRTRSASLVRSTIPLLLSEYVNEPFYAPLSPFLYDESLSKKRQRALDDYMASKRALVQELKAKIASLQNADPATRESQLTEFARGQTPKIAELEATAERIRDDLTRWKLFSNSSDWNEGRDWRLGDDTRWESNLDESKLMRGAAYFQDGLAPAQRRLLREYSMELDDSGTAPSEIGLDSRGPYLYFSPATSRIRLPANLSPDLQGKIAEYTREKMQLKREIRDVLYREDRRWFDSHRRNALRDLATAQAGRIAALDSLAEEIRRRLAPLPNPAKPRALTQSLPAGLANRISGFMEAKSQFEKTMNGRLNALKRDFRTSRVEYVKMGEGIGIQLVGNRRLNAEERAKLNQAAAELAPFNEVQIKAYAALAREKEAIRESLLNETGALAPMVTPRLVDLILRDYTSNLALQELWRKYADYETAVLQPGLSPEQRRLLYDTALVELDQQLPFYTY